jgi:hypothetical protein
MSTPDKQMLQRLRIEIASEDAAKKRNAEIARKSFENWSQGTIAVVGRATGYRISVAKSKLGKVWDWIWL